MSILKAIPPLHPVPPLPPLNRRLANPQLTNDAVPLPNGFVAARSVRSLYVFHAIFFRCLSPFFNGCGRVAYLFSGDVVVEAVSLLGRPSPIGTEPGSGFGAKKKRERGGGMEEKGTDYD